MGVFFVEHGEAVDRHGRIRPSPALRVRVNGPRVRVNGGVGVSPRFALTFFVEVRRAFRVLIVWPRPNRWRGLVQCQSLLGLQSPARR